MADIHEENAALRAEVAALQAEVAELRAKLATGGAPPAASKSPARRSASGWNNPHVVINGAAAALLLGFVGLFLLAKSGSASANPNDPSRAPDAVEVTGTVSLDGKPMPDGAVTFTAPDGRPPVDADVSNGQFTAWVVPGPKTVQINRYRDTGNRDETGKAIMISNVPDQFNIASKLKADVKKEGPNKFEFAVTTR